MSIKQRFYLKVGTERTCFSMRNDYSLDLLTHHCICKVTGFFRIVQYEMA